MRRLTKTIAAVALGLMLSLSLFTSGAFAQTVNATTATHTVVAQEASLAEQAASTTAAYSSGYNDHSRLNRGPDHKWRIKCVSVPVWVRTRHGFRRVWARYCRRY